MPSAKDLWDACNSLVNRHESTVNTLMAQWKAGEITAPEVWTKFPGWPQLQHGTYVTSLIGVHSPWMGNHNLYHLYMDVVKETGGDPNAGGLARPGSMYVLPTQDAERKTAEQEEYQKIREAALEAGKQEARRAVERRQWALTRELDRREEEEERFVRILRQVMREL